MKCAEQPSRERELFGPFADTFCDLFYQSQFEKKTFSAKCWGVRLGGLSVDNYEGHGFRGASREARHIRSDHIDRFIFALPLNAEMEVVQSGHRVLADPDVGVLLATSKPFEVALDESISQDYKELLIGIPGPQLRTQVPYVDDCCGRPLQMKQGAGKIMRSLIQSLLEEGGKLTEGQSARFGSLLLGSIVGIFPSEHDYVSSQDSPRETAYARIRRSATFFIENNLSNATLDANLVAFELKVSPRYLFAAFHDSTTTVGATIRELRLERCRSDLLNRSLRHQSLTQIAMRWGFGNSSGFSRTYFARFGKTPSDERAGVSSA